MIFEPYEQFVVSKDRDILEPVRKETEIIALFWGGKLRRIASQNEAARPDNLQFEGVRILYKAPHHRRLIRNMLQVVFDLNDCM